MSLSHFLTLTRCRRPASPLFYKQKLGDIRCCLDLPLFLRLAHNNSSTSYFSFSHQLWPKHNVQRSYTWIDYISFGVHIKVSQHQTWALPFFYTLHTSVSPCWMFLLASPIALTRRSTDVGLGQLT